MYSFLSWMLGIIFLVIGYGVVVAYPVPDTRLFLFAVLAASPLFISSALLLPPVREAVYDKTGKWLPDNARVAVIFALILVSVVLNGLCFKEKERFILEKEARQKAESLAAYFAENKAGIISELKELYDNGKYQEVENKAFKYDTLKDPEVIQLCKKAREHKLLAHVRKIPASQIQLNKNIYERLLTLCPENEKYNAKFNYYLAKVREKEEKDRRAAARQKRIDDQFAYKTGPHINLRRYIQNGMNDPNSFKHVSTVYEDKGTHLIVLTKFRGKNAFGGVVTHLVQAKVNLDGDVLEIQATR